MQDLHFWQEDQTHIFFSPTGSDLVSYSNARTSQKEVSAATAELSSTKSLLQVCPTFPTSLQILLFCVLSDPADPDQHLCYHNPRETCSLKSFALVCSPPKRFQYSFILIHTPRLQAWLSPQLHFEWYLLPAAVPRLVPCSCTAPEPHSSTHLSSCSAPSAASVAAGGMMGYVLAVLAWTECCHASLVHAALPVHFTPVLPCLSYISSGPLSAESASFTEMCQMACHY